MLPAFEDGVLPPGVHAATWQEVVDRLGWTTWRRELLEGLRDALGVLAGLSCRRVWLDGSFVTEKLRPGDFDLCWDLDGVDLERLQREHPVLADLTAPRYAQHIRFRGDLLPNVVEGNSGMPFIDFFQQDPETGAARGIILIELGGWS